MSIKRSVDPEVFKAYLKSRNMSISTLAAISASSEKTIKRCLKDGEVTLGVALDLCQSLECNFITLFGEDSSDKWKKTMVKLYKMIR